MRFNPRKADLARWRESFARELRERGIDAEATPRRARGIVQKAERTSVRKTRERAASAGALPDVVKGGRTTAAAMAQETPPAPRPWEVRTVVRQAEVRRSYAKAGALPEESGSTADLALARQTRAFVAAMPQPLVRDREQAKTIGGHNRPSRSVEDRERKGDDAPIPPPERPRRDRSR